MWDSFKLFDWIQLRWKCLFFFYSMKLRHARVIIHGHMKDKNLFSHFECVWLINSSSRGRTFQFSIISLFTHSFFSPQHSWEYNTTSRLLVTCNFHESHMIFLIFLSFSFHYFLLLLWGTQWIGARAHVSELSFIIFILLNCFLQPLTWYFNLQKNEVLRIFYDYNFRQLPSNANGLIYDQNVIVSRCNFTPSI
jgi:hypothetical protein